MAINGFVLTKEMLNLCASMTPKVYAPASKQKEQNAAVPSLGTHEVWQHFAHPCSLPPQLKISACEIVKAKTWLQKHCFFTS